MGYGGHPLRELDRGHAAAVAACGERGSRMALALPRTARLLEAKVRRQSWLGRVGVGLGVGVGVRARVRVGVGVRARVRVGVRVRVRVQVS